MRIIETEEEYTEAIMEEQAMPCVSYENRMILRFKF